MKAMKIWLLLAVMLMAIAVHARKNDDPEMRHVRLTDRWHTSRGLHSQKTHELVFGISSETFRQSRW